MTHISHATSVINNFLAYLGLIMNPQGILWEPCVNLINNVNILRLVTIQEIYQHLNTSFYSFNMVIHAFHEGISMTNTMQKVFSSKYWTQFKFRRLMKTLLSSMKPWGSLWIWYSNREQVYWAYEFRENTIYVSAHQVVKFSASLKDSWEHY